MRAVFVLQSWNQPIVDGVLSDQAELTMRCIECQSVTLFEVTRPQKMVLGKTMDDVAFFSGFKGDAAPFVYVTKTLPALTSQLEHEAIPAPVLAAYNEAMKAYQAGADSLAIMGLRKVVDLLAGAGGAPLAKRIAELDLPQALRDWAHAIREFGNNAAHTDFGASREAAREVAEFTRLLLEYHYVLPAKVSTLRTSLHSN